MKKLHPRVFAKTIQEKLTMLFSSLADEVLYKAIDMLGNIPDCWEQLSVGVQNRIEEYVSKMPRDYIHNLDSLFDYAPLKNAALRRLATADLQELQEMLFLSEHPLVLDRLIKLYLSSPNFNRANKIANDICLNSKYFSIDQQRQILEGVSKNAQIAESFTLGSVIEKLRSSEKTGLAEFEAMLECVGLEIYKLKKEDR